MSGEKLYSFLNSIFKKIVVENSTDPFSVESDQRLYNCIGTGSLFGIIVVTYLLSIQISIPKELCGGFIDPPVLHNPNPTIRGILPDDIHGKLHQTKIVKTHHRHVDEAAPKPVSRHPAEVTGTLVSRVINSKTDRTNLTAYDILNDAIQTLDQNKLE